LQFEQVDVFTGTSTSSTAGPGLVEDGCLEDRESVGAVLLTFPAVELEHDSIRPIPLKGWQALPVWIDEEFKPSRIAATALFLAVERPLIEALDDPVDRPVRANGDERVIEVQVCLGEVVGSIGGADVNAKRAGIRIGLV
jgi:hypothetical protein